MTYMFWSGKLFSAEPGILMPLSAVVSSPGGSTFKSTVEILRNPDQDIHTHVHTGNARSGAISRPSNTITNTNLKNLGFMKVFHLTPRYTTVVRRTLLGRKYKLVDIQPSRTRISHTFSPSVLSNREIGASQSSALQLVVASWRLARASAPGISDSMLESAWTCLFNSSGRSKYLQKFVETGKIKPCLARMR